MLRLSPNVGSCSRVLGKGQQRRTYNSLVILEKNREGKVKKGIIYNQSHKRSILNLATSCGCGSLTQIIQRRKLSSFCDLAWNPLDYKTIFRPTRFRNQGLLDCQIPRRLGQQASPHEGDNDIIIGTRNHGLEKEKERQPRTLDQVVYHLQADIRRKRKIHKADLHNGVELVEKAGKVDDFGSFLLNCCCDILPDFGPEYRVKLAERIWAVIQKSKEYSTGNFEAILKTLALNEDKLSDPFVYLKEAKAVGIEVTPTMYYFALLIVCQRGDIEAAVELLSLMEENNVPVNERFFNVLILGNARRGDLKSANEIIELMKTTQVNTSSQTWTMLLQAYIEAGNLELMKKTFTEDAGQSLSEDQFYDLIKAAGRQSSPQILDLVIDWALASRKMHYLSIMSATLQLLYFGHPENALKIILRFAETLKVKKEERLGAFFIKELDSVVSDPEKYTNLVVSLQGENLNPYALSMAAESCLKHRKFDLVYKIYEAMHVLNFPIRPHYFYPSFVTEARDDDGSVVGAIRVLKEMKSLGVKPDWEMMVAWIVPILFKVNEDKDMAEVLRIIQDACEVSYSSGLLSAGLVVALQEREIKIAVALIQRLNGRISHPDMLIQSLLKYVVGGDGKRFIADVSYITKILVYLAENIPSNDKKDYVGMFIVRLIELGLKDNAELLLKNLMQFDIPLSAAVAETIRDKLSLEDDVKVSSELEAFNGNGRHILSPNDMNLTNLECHKEELEAKDLNVRGTCRKLFFKYCQEGDFEKAIEAKNNFESNFGELSTGMKSTLMEVYIQNDLLEHALEIFRSLSNNVEGEENLEIDTYKIIDLANLMAKKGLVNDAVKLIKEECPKRLDHRPETFSRNVVRFLETISFANNALILNGETVEENLVYSLTEFFLKLGMMKPINPTLAPVIKDLIRRDKLKEAVEKLEEYSKRFRMAPALQQLTYRVLDSPELLNRVIKCSTAVKGIREAKRLLALAKADVGDVDGAAAVLLELGDQLSFLSMIKQCEYLASKKDFEKLLNLIKALHKTGRAYNCSGLYKIAIKACERCGDIESLKRVLTSMQENDLYIPDSAKKMIEKKELAR